MSYDWRADVENVRQEALDDEAHGALDRLVAHIERLARVAKAAREYKRRCWDGGWSEENRAAARRALWEALTVLDEVHRG